MTGLRTDESGVECRNVFPFQQLQILPLMKTDVVILFENTHEPEPVLLVIEGKGR